MGQVPAKWFYPPTPYGNSTAAAVVNPSQPAAVNPQTPLLPPNFQNTPTMAAQTSQAASTQTGQPYGSNPGNRYNHVFFGGPPFARGY